MKKSFMTRVLAVSLSAAMAFSMSSASNLMTASAASTVNLKTTFKTLKVNQTYQLKLTNNTLNWKITKVTTSNKKICTVYNKKASSVMLKGKGVGRAKIKVKVKTTKRKYPKNIKYMTCTANVKAAAEDNKPVENAFSATVTPVSLTQVRVTFNKAVDDASDASKFTISDGVTVTKSDPEADKLSTVLTIDGAQAGKSYDLTVKGMAVNGAAQADLNLKFTAPASDIVNTGYKMVITPEKSIVKSDGQTQTRVTFEIQKDDKTVTDQTAQIEFSVSRGKFADTRATLKDGKVEVMYSASQENTSVPAVITATVVESSDPKMVGTQGVGNITLSPNPDNLTSEAAIITSAAAGTADRVIAYFDKEVDASQFMKDGRPDASKFDCTIKTGLDSSFSDSNGVGTELKVVAILPVANEPKALEILVDKPLKDNANASIKFRDRRSTNNNIDTTNTANFRLADAREPSVLSVKSSGTKEIEVEFSEAVLPHEFVRGLANEQYAANHLNNYLIDGRPLSYYGISTVERDGETAGLSSSEISRTEKKILSKEDESFSAKDGKVVLQSYTVKDKVGTDNRHKVKIIVGSGHVLSTGSHLLTVRNVGDWAAETDAARNSVSTQVLPFDVQENAEKPEFAVTIQSPEQYELNFNTSFKIVDGADKFTTADTSVDGAESVVVLQERVNGTWTNISNGVSASSTRGQNPIRVSRVGDDDKKYLVEVKRDWSEVYDFNNTRQDYYNKQFRLHVDAGKLVNVSNNLRNDEINIELRSSDSRVTNGNIMEGADLESPKVVGVTQATAKNGTLLHSWNVELSEPVKISPEANEEGLTPSQKQAAGINATTSDTARRNKGVPVAFARFVNVDNPSQIIEGEVEENFFIDAEDKVINVAPETKLGGGSWRLVVGSISDDYGSTLATDGGVIEVPADSVETGFKVVWAAVATSLDYDNALMGNVGGNNRGGFVYIKFNKPVNLAAALDENNYALNNQPLPHGANIHANIKNYDDHDSVTDSVTIELPQGSNLLYNQYTVDTLSTQLSINGVTSAAGEALSGSGMNQLPYNIGESGNTISTKNNVQIATNRVDNEHDAVWGNAASENIGASNFKTDADYYAALRSALDDDKYRKVEVSPTAFTGLTGDKLKAVQSVFGKNLVININRAVDVDFNNAAIAANVVVNTTDAVNAMTISNVTLNGTAEKVRGTSATLTVNAGVVKDFVLENVTVTNGVNDRAILLNNVWTDSFVLGQTSNVSGVIYVSDTDGFGFDNQSGWDGDLVINSSGVINLKGSLKGANITVQQAATLNLGTVDENGNVTKSLDIDGAKIRIEGAEAKVMITKATETDINNLPTITAAAKDVKVYLAANAISQLGTAQCIKVDKGNVVEIDKDGRKVTSTTANPNFRADDINAAANITGIQKALESLKLVSTGATVEATYSDFVSAGAFEVAGVSEGVIDRDVFSEDIAKEVAARVKTEAYGELQKADGSEIKYTDLAVNCSLSSNATIFDQDSEYIKPKSTKGAGPDIITISLTYNGVTYNRIIRVRN